MDPVQDRPLQDRPLFFVNNDSFLQTETKFLQIIKTITTTLNSIIPQQVKISVWLYSRYAPEDEIKSKHSEWTKQLQDLSTEITKCVQLIQEPRNHLPLLKDRTTIHSVWTDLLELEHVLHFTRKKNEDLRLILNSPIHQEALRSYKNVIKKCELGMKSSVNNISQRIQGISEEMQPIIAAQKSAITHFDPRLKEEILFLQDETQTFLSYAFKSVPQNNKQKPKPFFSDDNAIEQLYSSEAVPLSPSDDPDLDSSDEGFITDPAWALAQGLTNLEIPQDPEYVENTFQPIQNQNTQINSQYLSECKKASLNSLHSFKQGSMGISFRYPTQYPLIQKFEQAAKGLQKIESDVDQSMKMLWKQQQTNDYSTSLNYFEEKLKTLKEKLLKQPFSDEIHPILHYVAGLFAWRQEIQERINYLSEINSTHWAPIRTAQNEILEYLRLATSFKSKKTTPESNLQLVKKFYTVIQAAILLPSPPANQETFYQKLQCQIIDHIKTFIAQEGPKILALTNIENDILKQLPVNLDLKHIKTYPFEMTKTAIKSLIAKKIIHCLYFTKSPCDPELDILFPTLQQIDKQYRIQSSDKDFFNICSKYSSLTLLPQDQYLLETYNRLFFHTGRIESNNPHIFVPFVYYCACQQLLRELSNTKKSTTLSSSHRLNTLHSIIEPKLVKIRKEYRFPDYCTSFEDVLEYPYDTISQMPKADLEKTLHQLLVIALWAKKENEKLLATSILAKLFEVTPTIQKISLSNQHIKFLIDYFILQRISQKIQLSPFEEGQLRLLFIDYLKNPTIWQQHYSIVFLEKALYIFLFNYPYTHDKNFFPDNCQPKRDLCSTLWKSILENYISFEEAKKQSSDSSIFINEIKQHEKLFSSLDPFYRKLFSTCLQRMTEG